MIELFSKIFNFDNFLEFKKLLNFDNFIERTCGGGENNKIWNLIVDFYPCIVDSFQSLLILILLNWN